MEDRGIGVGTFVLGVALVAGLGGGCGSPDGAWRGTEVDSAGVLVVANPDEADREAPWAPALVLEVGAVDGADGLVFAGVTDVEVDGRGRLAILDGPGRVVRILDGDGELVATFGGPGEGPGELSRFAGSLFARGDTLTVVDWGGGARVRYAADGTPLEERPLPGPGGTRSWWRHALDGAVWYRSLTRITDDDGRWAGDDRLVRLGPDGGPVEVMRFRYAEADLGGPGEPRVPLVVNAPAWDVAADGAVAWVTLDDGRLRIHGPDGRLRFVVTQPVWTPVPARPEDRDPLVEALGLRLGMLGGDPAAARAMDTHLPDRLPGITSVRAGPDGTWWVQRRGDLREVQPGAVNTPDPPLAWGGPLWDVVGPDGRYRGTLALPPGSRVVRIRDGRVVGVTVDDLGVERVAVWRLEASAG